MSSSDLGRSALSEQIWPWPAEGRAWGLHRVGAGQMESERSGAALQRSQVTTKARARSRAAKPAHRGSERSLLLFWTCAEEELDLTSKVQSAWQSTEDKVREAPFHNLLRNFVPPSWRSLPSFSPSLQPAVLSLSLYAVIGVWAISGVIKVRFIFPLYHSTYAARHPIALLCLSALLQAVDSWPPLAGLMELVGIGYSGYFIYSNLLFKRTPVSSVPFSLSQSVLISHPCASFHCRGPSAPA